MNRFLPDQFEESIQRLALGLEPVDAGLGLRVPHAIRITFDSDPIGLPRPQIDRHHSCRHVLLFDPSFTNSVDLRILDPSRHFVPRRLRIPIRSVAQADSKPAADRVRRPSMFPGAAYDATSLVTGLRGRVLRGGRPMRWARVAAATPGTNKIQARAHGDDRGEFLLLIGSGVAPVSDSDVSVQFDLQVSGPTVIPVPAAPDLPGIDPLWDLPLEKPLSLGSPDPVDPNDPMFAGLTLPDTYTILNTTAVTFPLGQVISQDFIV
jgi:hypothetical protein